MNVPEPRLDHHYQEMILDHNKRPKNFKVLEHPTQYSHGHNTLCGDDYYLYLRVTPEGKIEDVGFQGKGCAISKASASMMTAMIKDLSSGEAVRLKNEFINFMTKDIAKDESKPKVGRLVIFEGVKEFPVRVKCATLIWRTLEDALNGVPERKE